MYRAVNMFSERTPILNPQSRKRGSSGSFGISCTVNSCVEKFYEGSAGQDDELVILLVICSLFSNVLLVMRNIVTHQQKNGSSAVNAKSGGMVIPARYVLAIISSVGFFFVYAMRVNLSVAMVAMVGYESDLDMVDTACKELLTLPLHNSTFYSNATTTSHGIFDWDSKTQGDILAAFFYGYVITQIPGGIIAEKYGAKWLYGGGVLITAIFTLVTPFAAQYGQGALMAVRAIEGLGEGVTYPAMNALIGRWVPKNERSRIATIIYTGSPIGTVVSMAVSGYLSSSSKYGGWPAVFYLFGGLATLWFIFWIFLVHESPEEHPRISKSELQHIRAGTDRVSHGSSGPIPWRAILTSPRVWALVVTHWGFNWGFYTLLTELPTYLSNILHFDLKHNGLLSALPYLFQTLFAFMASAIADKMRSSGRYRITTIRKIMNSIAFFIPCVLVGCISFVGCNAIFIITLLMLSLAFSGFMYSGFNVTHVDMSPAFAGTLMGITNCVANTAGFLAPLYAGSVIHSGQTIENWRTVFLTTSGIYLITGLIYLFCASAELQPWGLPTTPSACPTDEEASAEKEKSPN